jgi:hypothetical protein
LQNKNNIFQKAVFLQTNNSIKGKKLPFRLLLEQHQFIHQEKDSYTMKKTMVRALGLKNA